MKALLVGIFLATFIVSAHSETFVITGTIDSNENGVPSVYLSKGFNDSSFNSGESNFCYLGNVNKVCSIVEKSANQIHKNYLRGNSHDNMTINNCSIDKKNTAVIEVSYKLEDDYSGKREVVTKIAECQ